MGNFKQEKEQHPGKKWGHYSVDRQRDVSDAGSLLRCRKDVLSEITDETSLLKPGSLNQGLTVEI